MVDLPRMIRSRPPLRPWCFYLEYDYIYFVTSEGGRLTDALMDWVWSIDDEFVFRSKPKEIGRSFWVTEASTKYLYDIYQIKKGQSGSLYSFILDLNHDIIPGQAVGKSPRDALISWLSKKSFGQDKIGTIRIPALIDEGMWKSSFMIGDMVGICRIVRTDSGLRLVKR